MLCTVESRLSLSALVFFFLQPWASRQQRAMQPSSAGSEKSLRKRERSFVEPMVDAMLQPCKYLSDIIHQLPSLASTLVVVESIQPQAGRLEHPRRPFFRPIVSLTQPTLCSMSTLSLSPPKGYDSIVARGCQEPDPSKDVVIKLEGKSVSVPQGKPTSMTAYKGSRFSNSEYLVRCARCACCNMLTRETRSS